MNKYEKFNHVHKEIRRVVADNLFDIDDATAIIAAMIAVLSDLPKI